MIYVERTITVSNDRSSIEKPILLYKGDKNVEVQFTIKSNPFKYANESETAYGQLIIKRPEASPIVSDIFKYEANRVVFLITGEMIDELIELGSYTLQVRLYDMNKTSRITLPPIHGGIIIEQPIYEEDYSEAMVNVALVDYNVAARSGVEIDVFDEDGNYNKVIWQGGDLITDSKLNHIENALYEINDAVANIDVPDVDLSDYATKEYVDDAVANIEISGGGSCDCDLTGYATKEELDKAITVIDKIEAGYDDFPEGQSICRLTGGLDIRDINGNTISQLGELSRQLVYVYKSNAYIYFYTIDNKYIHYNISTGNVVRRTYNVTKDYVDEEVANATEGLATKEELSTALGDIESLLKEI